MTTLDPATPETFRSRFHASGADFALIVLKNLFLTVVTFGIYAGWAKTNRRKFIWQNTEFHGQRLSYTGQGIDLFKGYLKVGGAYIGLVIIAGLFKLLPQIIQILGQVAISVFILVAIPYAMYSSRRYLLRNTRWRGIRLGLDPAGRWLYAREFCTGTLLTVITLGLYFPIRANRLNGILIRHTSLGSLPFRYEGTDREAFKIFIKALPLMILTLGIYSFWYQAQVLRFRFRITWVGQAQGEFRATGGEFVGLVLVNLLLTILTLGLGFPWVVTRNLSFVLERITFGGTIDFESILQQQASQGSAFADSMADALDVDLGL